jgi:sulfate adenylyltransferase
MRMAGPREAVWHAQIRKNYGCTHFVVGRDHAGPSYKTKEGKDFYGPYDAQELLMKHADEIGIKVIISKLIVYALPKKEGLSPMHSPIDMIDSDNYDVQNISGTKQREILKNGEELPEWFTFPEIAKELTTSYQTNRPGICLYFVGLSGSGKTTLCNYIISKLKEISNTNITYLDGDVVRRELSKGLGFSKEDRSLNARRIGYVCSEVVKHGGIAIAANIAPYKSDRNHNRDMITQYGSYVEVYVNTDLDECEKRDVKGFYKMAREGKIKEFTGISDPFEEPENPELNLNGSDAVELNLEKIIHYLVDNKLL